MRGRDWDQQEEAALTFVQLGILRESRRSQPVAGFLGFDF